MSENNEQYLGAGVYVSFEDGHVRLRQSRISGDRIVALAPAVVVAMQEFLVELARMQAVAVGAPIKAVRLKAEQDEGSAAEDRGATQKAPAQTQQREG
jgi:hypothetical protein